MVDGLVNLGVLALVAEAAVGQPDVQPTLSVFSGTPLSDRVVDEDEGKVVLQEEPKGEGRFKTPHTLPRFEALSPDASGSGESTAHPQMEAEERAQQMEREHRLQMRRMEFEMEVEKAVRIRRLELEAQQRRTDVCAPTEFTGPQVLDISKYVALVPGFREDAIDTFLMLFNVWPPDRNGLQKSGPY